MSGRAVLEDEEAMSNLQDYMTKKWKDSDGEPIVILWESGEQGGAEDCGRGRHEDRQNAGWEGMSVHSSKQSFALTK